MMGLTRRVIYGLATSESYERLVRRSRWLSALAFGRASRFVGGLSLDDALRTIEVLQREGLSASLDLFGENTLDPAILDNLVESYRDAADKVRAIALDVYLEVVPSHLGVDGPPDAFRGRLKRIAEVLPSGSRLHLSAEESWRTDAIIESTLALREEGWDVMATIQANLRRSPEDIKRLAGAQIPMRLVKGAYIEPRSVALKWGDETDVAYIRLAHLIHSAGSELSLGTHDPLVREAVLSALPDVGVEMLMGVRPADARDLVRRGLRVRIYVPYGDAWFRYWLRRLAESRGTG